MMHVYNRMLHLFSALLISFGVSAQSDLVITGVMDGPLSGGTPKVLELYVMSDVADASAYKVYRYSNGGSSASSVYTFPAIALTAGQHYTIASDSAKYFAFFGSNADGFGSLYINGDDIVELRMGSDTVDVFGQYGVDGSGQCWDHLDGWAYRNNGVSPTASFDCNEWTFSGTNALDGQTTNAGAPTPFPSATYTGTSAPSFTTYTVTNVGVVFTPESLAIELGDSVHWSISGNHNVNGSQGTYPNNPESFYSGPAPITSFGHRFTISGAYDYQCDPHVGIGQTGYIEVQGPLNPVSNLAMASNGEDEVNVSWTQPAGAHGVDWDGVAVFMSESPFSSFFTNNAQELSNYTGNFSYTGGTSVSADGSNSGYCIYNSTSNSGGNIDIDGLNAGTTYYVVAYAYRTVAASDDDVSAEEAASVTTDSPVINSDLIITGIMDGPLSGGTPKALEIYAMNDVADISSYTVQFAGNGGASYNVAAQLPAIGLNAGDFYYVTTDSAQFYAYLGFSADQKGGAYPNGLYINGDDHVALFKGSYPVDYYGVYQVDGTGECWDHLDGWAYRNNNSSPTTAFDCAEWTFSGTNALDGTSTNATAPNPWPVGTYGTVAVVDLEVTEIMSSSAHSNANSDGDWFEIRNNGSTSVNLNGYSWDNSSQTAGTHTFGNYVLAAGQSLIVLDEDSSSIQAWSNTWGQTANSIRVIARDMIGLTGFDDLSNAGDGVYLYDANGALIESAVFAVGNTGNSVEFSNGTPTQSIAGINGAYTSPDGDVGSPGDMTPVYVTVPTYSISQVRSVDANGVADSLNTYCKLSGTVTSIDFDGNSGYSFYMTDGTQGINVYRSSDLSNYTSPAMGDNIEVTGTIAQFNGLLEIIPDSLTLVPQNNTVPAPMIVTTLNESTESELITFENVTLVDTADWPTSATSSNVDFVNSRGDTLTMRIDYDAAIFGNTPLGSFDLTGIGAQYDASSPYLEGYQIFPRSNADIYTGPVIPSYNIAQVRGVDSLGVADSVGVYCKLTGTVTSIDFDGNSGYNFYISDGTRGIYVYRSSDLSNYTAPSMGDDIRVVGSIGQFRGLTQMNPDSITLISQNNTLPSPILVNSLDESTEGELILLENVTLVDTADWPSQRTSKNIDIYTANGDTLAMRIDYDADIYGNTPAGSFDLIGMGGQYDASSPYFEGYQILPRGWSDITMNNTGTGGTSFQQYCYQVDSIYTIGQAKKGRFRATFGQLATGEKYRFRWVQADANYNIDSTQIRSKEFNNPNKGYMNFSVAPWFNSKVLVWLEVDTLNGQGEVWANPLACTADRNGATVLPIPLGGGGGVIVGSVIDGDMEEVSVPCKPQTLTLVEQAAATCPTDSALLRAGYAGGTGNPSYLWSTGDTTKRIYVAQGATVSVTVTDEVGCSVSDSITASILAYASEAPSGVSVSNSGPSVRIVSWSASTMGAGQTLIGYRVQYRVRGTSSWTNAPLTANTTDTIDFTGAGPAGTSENYEFSVVARFTDTDATNKTSARACFVSKGVTYKGGNGSSSLMSGGSMAITVYPNPAKDVVYVSAPIGSTVELMDISGRIMATQISEGIETSFGLSDMADGIYMIQIKSNGEVTTERLVKQ